MILIFKLARAVNERSNEQGVMHLTPAVVLYYKCLRSLSLNHTLWWPPLGVGAPSQHHENNTHTSSEQSLGVAATNWFGGEYKTHGILRQFSFSELHYYFSNSGKTA